MKYWSHVNRFCIQAYIIIKNLGILSSSDISGELSAIQAEFVLADITWFHAYRQSAGIAEMFAVIAGIAENSHILDNTPFTNASVQLFPVL